MFSWIENELIHPPGPHVWRWRLIQFWIIVFTGVVAWLISDNRDRIHTVAHNSASVREIEKTNCALKQFLISAEIARLKEAKEQTGAERETNLRAARAYYTLAIRFHPNELCPLLKPPKPPED